MLECSLRKCLVWKGLQQVIFLLTELLTEKQLKGLLRPKNEDSVINKPLFIHETFVHFQKPYEYTLVEIQELSQPSYTATAQRLQSRGLHGSRQLLMH